MKYYGYDGLIVATKADKISRNQYQKSFKVIRDTLGLDGESVIIPTSATKRTGLDQLKEEISKVCSSLP